MASASRSAVLKERLNAYACGVIFKTDQLEPEFSASVVIVNHMERLLLEHSIALESLPVCGIGSID